MADDQPADTQDDPLAFSDCDPFAPGAEARLAARTPEHSYVIRDARLVLAARAYHKHGDSNRCKAVLQVLIERCKPMFRKMARGLISNREVFNDAIQDMSVQIIAEALDPNEVFMTQNFAVYLHRLCVDNFQRALRSEGKGYRVNEQGQVVGRPQHIPSTLVHSIDHTTAEGKDLAEAVPDPGDEIELQIGEIHARDILRIVPDPLDRTIIWLRVWMDMTWEDIADTCRMSERTMREHFKNAIEGLRATLSLEERI